MTERPAISAKVSKLPERKMRPGALRIASQLLLLAIDCSAIHLAFSLAGQVRGDYWLLVNGYPVKWLAMFCYAAIAINGQAVRRSSFLSLAKSLAAAERAMVWAAAMTIMIIFFSQTALLLSRLALATAFVLSALLIAVGRSLFLTLFVVDRNSFWEKRVLIVDGGIAYDNFAGDVIDAAELGIAPDLSDPAMVARLGEYASGYDNIVISCRDHDRRSDWAYLLKAYDVHCELILDDGPPVGAIGIGRIGDEDTLVISRGRMSLANRLQKRAFDIVVASLLLVLLSPLLIATAIGIRLDSPGPVLFRQPRVGYQNRIFQIFKFRSMRAASGDVAGVRSATKDDDRITPVGRFIRRTSIDELPQLFNVVLGDMSLVGPRPHALGSQVGDQLFWEIDDSYWRRHSLKPGITGLAQVRGFRGATHKRSDLIDRLRADIEYLDGWTLVRDIRILLATARVIVHSNAY